MRFVRFLRRSGMVSALGHHMVGPGNHTFMLPPARSSVAMTPSIAWLTPRTPSSSFCRAASRSRRTVSGSGAAGPVGVFGVLGVLGVFGRVSSFDGDAQRSVSEVSV